MNGARSITIAFQNTSSTSAAVISFSPPPGSEWAPDKAPTQGQMVQCPGSATWRQIEPFPRAVTGTVTLALLAGGTLSIYWEWDWGAAPIGGASILGSNYVVTYNLSNIGTADVTLNVELASSQ